MFGPMAGCPLDRPATTSLGRQIDDEDIDGSAGQKRAGHRNSFVRRSGLEDDEPLEPDPAGDGLDRIEAAGKIDPGGNRTAGLGLGHQPQGQGGLPARGLAAQGNGGIARHATWSDDRIEGGEPGPDHPIRVGRPTLRPGQAAGQRLGQPGQCRVQVEFGGDRERADDPRSCRSPARPKGCESGRNVRGKARHGPQMIEQMFCFVKGQRPCLDHVTSLPARPRIIEKFRRRLGARPCSRRQQVPDTCRYGTRLKPRRANGSARADRREASATLGAGPVLRADCRPVRPSVGM